MSPQLHRSDNRAAYNDSTIVVLYGVPNCGKTCFLASFLWHLRAKGFDYDLNVKDNPEGVALFNELIQHLSRRRVPRRTPGDTGFELDLKIKGYASEKVFTIVDIAGETSSLLATLDASSKAVNTKVGTEINEVLKQYLAIQDNDVIVLCFIDIFSEDFHPNDQELGAENLLMHIKQTYPHIFNIGIVLTKIDKFPPPTEDRKLTYHEMSEEAEKYAKKESLFYKMHMNPTNMFGKRIRIIPFAIGRVDEDSGLISEQFDGGFESLRKFLRISTNLSSPKNRGVPILIGLIAFTILIVLLRVKDGVSPSDLFLAFLLSTVASIIATFVTPPGRNAGD